MKQVRNHVVAALAFGLTLILTLGLSAPAQASSMSFSKESGRMAEVSWLEVGELPAPVLGNAHLGKMFIEDLGNGNFRLFGWVEDYECLEGELPGGGGHGKEEESGCQPVDFRKIEKGTSAFTMDRKFNVARLTGNLSVIGGHDGEVLGAPPVNMTWTGVGDLFKSTEAYTYDDGTYSETYRYTRTGRNAVISGNIGPMVFDDEPFEYSFASMGAYRGMSRYTGP